MKATELREKNTGELEKLLEESREAFYTLRFEIASREAKSHRAVRKTRKTIARILTILAETAIAK